MRKGFTLIELMISIAILAVGLSVILQGFAHSLNILKISQDNLQATLVLEERMFELEMAAKEVDSFRLSNLHEKFQFADLECDWSVRSEEVKLETEEFDLQLQEPIKLYRVEANLSWQEGRRSGQVPLITHLRIQEEE